MGALDILGADWGAYALPPAGWGWDPGEGDCDGGGVLISGWAGRGGLEAPPTRSQTKTLKSNLSVAFPLLFLFLLPPPSWGSRDSEGGFLKLPNKEVPQLSPDSPNLGTEEREWTRGAW